MLTCADCEYGNCNFNCKKCKYDCKKGVFIKGKNNVTVAGGKCFHGCSKCNSFKQIIN